MAPPSSLAAFFVNDTHIAPSCDLRGFMALSVRSLLTRPTLGNPFSPTRPTELLCNRLPRTRPFPGRRWRYACPKFHSDLGLGWNKLRSQVTIEPCGLPR